MSDSSSYYLNQFKRSLLIVKKNVKVYYSKGPVIIFGVVLPMFLFLAYFIGRNISLHEAFPGLLGMTVFFSSTSVGPTIAPWESRLKTLERLICSPISLWSIFLGDVLSSFLFGFLISLIPLILGLILEVAFINYFLIVGVLILGTMCFSAFSILLSAYPPSDMPSTIMMLTSLIRFPLIFISGVFAPLSALPSWGIILSSISPLTYFVDLTRVALGGGNYYPLYLDLIILAVVGVLFFIVAVSIHKHTILKRFS